MRRRDIEHERWENGNSFRTSVQHTDFDEQRHCLSLIKVSCTALQTSRYSRGHAPSLVIRRVMVSDMFLRCSTRAARPTPTPAGPCALDTVVNADAALELVLATLSLPELARFGCVSRRCRDLSLRPALYTHLSFQDVSRPGMVTPDVITKLCRRGGQDVTSIDLGAVWCSGSPLLRPKNSTTCSVIEALVGGLRDSGLRILECDRDHSHFYRHPLSVEQFIALRTACPQLTAYYGAVYGSLCTYKTAPSQETFVSKLQPVLPFLPIKGAIFLVCERSGGAADPATIHAFALALSGFSAVVSLTLTHGTLGDAAVEALVEGLIVGNAGVQRLELQCNSNLIGGNGAAALARLLSSPVPLGYLDVSSNGPIPEEALFAAARGRRLPLKLYYSRIADAGLADRQTHIERFPGSA